MSRRRKKGGSSAALGDDVDDAWLREQLGEFGGDFGLFDSNKAKKKKKKRKKKVAGPSSSESSGRPGNSSSRTAKDSGVYGRPGDARGHSYDDEGVGSYGRSENRRQQEVQSHGKKSPVREKARTFSKPISVVEKKKGTPKSKSKETTDDYGDDYDEYDDDFDDDDFEDDSEAENASRTESKTGGNKGEGEGKSGEDSSPIVRGGGSSSPGMRRQRAAAPQNEPVLGFEGVNTTSEALDVDLIRRQHVDPARMRRAKQVLDTLKLESDSFSTLEIEPVSESELFKRMLGSAVMHAEAQTERPDKYSQTESATVQTASAQMPDDLWMVMSGARSDEAVLSEITASMGPKSDKGSTVYNGLVENRKKKHAFMSFLREAAGTMQAVTSANARNRAQDAVGISTQANETKADDGAGRNRIDFNFPSFLGMEKRSVDAVVSGGGYMFATAHGPEAKPNELYMRGLKMESSSGPRFGVRVRVHQKSRQNTGLAKQILSRKGLVCLFQDPNLVDGREGIEPDAVFACEGRPLAACLTPAGASRSILATGTDSGSVVIWDLQNPVPMFKATAGFGTNKQQNSRGRDIAMLVNRPSFTTDGELDDVSSVLDRADALSALSSSKHGTRGLGIHCSAVQDVRFVVEARSGLTQLLSLDQSGQLITWVVVDEEVEVSKHDIGRRSGAPGSSGGGGMGGNGSAATSVLEQKNAGEALGSSRESPSSTSSASSTRIKLVQSACVDFTAHALPPLRVVEPFLCDSILSRFSSAPNDILVACGGGQILRYAPQSSGAAKSKGLVLDKYSVKPVTGLGWELGIDIPPPPLASGEGDEPFGVTCVSSSPHLPGVFLVGCQNGDVCMFVSNTHFEGMGDIGSKREQFLRPAFRWDSSTSREGTTGGDASDAISIVSVQWAPHRPGTFYVLDSLSILHCWDLLRSMWEPVCSLDLRSKYETEAGTGNETATALSQKSSVVGFSIAGCKDEGESAYAVAGALGGEVRAVQLPAKVGKAGGEVEEFKQLLTQPTKVSTKATAQRQAQSDYDQEMRMRYMEK